MITSRLVCSGQHCLPAATTRPLTGLPRDQVRLFALVGLAVRTLVYSGGVMVRVWQAAACGLFGFLTPTRFVLAAPVLNRGSNINIGSRLYSVPALVLRVQRYHRTWRFFSSCQRSCVAYRCVFVTFRVPLCRRPPPGFSWR